MTKHRPLLAIVVIMIAVASALLHAQTQPRTAPALLISSGDLLEVNVLGTPEMSGKFRVNERGELSVPLVAPLSVQGMTAEQAAAAIEARFVEADVLRHPEITVFIAEYATQGVTVSGEVKTPGVYPVLGVRSLLDVIAAAGGMTPTASKQVTIVRRADPEHPVQVTVSTKLEDLAKASLQLMPGDTVVVPRAGVVYVVGEVGKPGGFMVENTERLTVLQALALAEGTKRTASLSRTRLIHKSAGNATEEKLDLKGILAGKVRDRQLQDGDVLFIPGSGAKNLALRSMEAAMQITTGLVIYRR